MTTTEKPLVDPVEFAEEMAELARTHLERDGEVSPVCFVLTPDNELEILSLAQAMGNDAEKEATFQYIRRHAKETNARAILLIVESWMRFFEKQEELPEDGHILPYSDKKECVMFNLATREGNKFACMEIITKLPDETKTFGKFEWANATGIEGRAVITLE